MKVPTSHGAACLSASLQHGSHGRDKLRGRHFVGVAINLPAMPCLAVSSI